MSYSDKVQAAVNSAHETAIAGNVKSKCEKNQKNFMRPQKGRLFAPEIPAPTSKSRGSSGDSY